MGAVWGPGAAIPWTEHDTRSAGAEEMAPHFIGILVGPINEYTTTPLYPRRFAARAQFYALWRQRSRER
jgi:hypothetical protein